jgi:Helix-turn-helix domain
VSIKSNAGTNKPAFSSAPTKAFALFRTSLSSELADVAAQQGAVAVPEPFVTPKEAALFLCLTVRRVLEMARSGQLPAHPLGVGKRHTWRFRLSELAHALVANHSLGRSGTILAGSPSGPGQEK